MGSMLGFPLAMPLGGNRVSNVRARNLGGRQWLVRWTPNNIPDTPTYMVSIDGQLFGHFRNRSSFRFRSDVDAMPVIQIVQLPAGFGDVGLYVPGYFTTIQPNRIRITWSPPADTTNVKEYRIYWDRGEGTVQYGSSYLMATVKEAGISSYVAHTPEIVSGTYRFVVRTVDFAGNETQNSDPFTQSLTTYPRPVRNLAVSYSNATKLATLTWNDPFDIGEAGTVSIFHNGGSTTNRYPDYDTIVATVAQGVESWTSGVLTEGYWTFGARVWNGSLGEANTSILASIRLDASANEMADFPPQPVLLAFQRAQGRVHLRALVRPSAALSTAATVNFFTNDGAGGTVNYGSAINATAVSLRALGEYLVGDYTTGTYGETPRLFGCRAYEAGGAASLNATEITVTPNSTSPPFALNVATVAARQ